MTDWFYAIDLALFRFGNDAIAHPALDVLFPFITDTHNWYLMYGLAVLSLLLFDGKRGIIAVTLLFFVVLAGDQLSSTLIKPLVGRVRPCSAVDAVRLLVPCGGGKSFPSSHAVNNFAMAFLMARLYRGASWYLFIYAALVAISRVYTGVHYPADVLGGAILGIGVGWGVFALYRAVDACVQRRLHSTLLSLPERRMYA